MKKYLAIFAAFLIGLYAGLPQAALAARQEKSVEDSGESRRECPPDVTPSEAPKAETGRLQVPQNWAIVIDPFEMDEKGQIYSEEYTIRNAGKEKGILTLHSLACTPEKGSGVTVKQNRQGIHKGEKKSFYLEMVFGSGDRVVLSPKETEYRIELEPGGELSVSFNGELNENAAGGWNDGDVEVSIKYSWEPKEGNAESRGEQREEPEEDKVKDAEEVPKDQEVSPTAPDADDGGSQEEKIIRLRESREWILTADSWTTDQEGRMVSRGYVLKNDSDTEGILRIGIPRGDGEEASYTDASSGEAEEERQAILLIDGEEQPGQTGGAPLYEAELAPGEKVEVCFGRNMNEDDLAGQGKNHIRATAECSWES